MITSYPPFALAWLTAEEIGSPTRVYVTPLDGNGADAKQLRWSGRFKGSQEGVATVSAAGLPHTPVVKAYAPEKRVSRYALALDGKGFSQRSETWPPRLSVTPIAYQRLVDFGDRTCVIGIRYYLDPAGETFAAFDERHEWIGLIEGRAAILPDLKQRDPNIPHDRDWSTGGFYVCIAIP
ncbi:MAG: hypothetical protein QY323_04810 [Patescibacteria group bacterium]|nr:MAG: hypothetical protein QY323_04810 [Patescibacteria group bacterium]